MSPAGVALVALVIVFSPGIVQTCARVCRRPDHLERTARPARPPPPPVPVRLQRLLDRPGHHTVRALDRLLGIVRPANFRPPRPSRRHPADTRGACSPTCPTCTALATRKAAR
ncbi:hypothetical protein LUR56_21640 [Streptomyces sp. MT29]|nr:hypothetical protein [Streptomyces sp. MT29]